MDTQQDYLAPAGFGEAELVEKRSRFIARVWPAPSEADALARIVEMRRQHRDATHNVFAYIIRGGPTRCSDDGEPQGTSGQPTLNVFQSENIENVCCVVTRYYGGTPLGAGGLVRAYSRAAKLALDKAGITRMRQWRVLLIPCPYALYERVKQRVEACGGFVESSDFGAEVLLKALVPVDSAQDCVRGIADLSAGGIEVTAADTIFRGGGPA